MLHLLSVIEQIGAGPAMPWYEAFALMIGAVLTLGKRDKDEGYKARLAGFPVPRLLDLHDSLSKKASPAAPAPKGEKKRKARTKKAKAKAAA